MQGVRKVINSGTKNNRIHDLADTIWTDKLNHCLKT